MVAKIIFSFHNIW